MKRFFCFFLAVLITAMSIILYCPFNIYANDAFTISKNSTEKTGLSADEAQKAIDANADIKGKDGVTMLLYTPSDSYNYTLKSGAFVAHLSDSQAKAMLMSKKSFQQYVVLCSSLISNGTVFRGFLKTVGIATTGDSDALTNIVDKFTCNYNYIDSINYDEDTQTITMSNDNSSVDELREEIKNYWYKEKGLLTGAVGSYHCSTKSYFLNNILKNGWFDYEEDYNEYFNNIKNTDYSFVFTDDNNSAYVTYLLNKSDISYFYLNHEFSDYYSLNFANSVGNNVGFTNITNRLNLRDFYSSITSRDYSDCDTSVFSSIKFYLEYYNSVYSFKQSYSSRFLKKDGSEYDVLSSNGTYYFVCDELPLIFKNEASMMSFIEGSDSFLASTINKTGEDITFSIDKMNENIGEKLDSLIDSINSGKSNMSADELQNAIDKGLEDLNKNTEDIKDNTSDILDTLKEQNNILLQILGVTEYIAYQNDKYNNTYTKADMSNLFKKSFNRVSDAVLYGEKVDDDNENTVDRSKFSYHNGILGHFPFSVPYQLYEWLKVFQAEPECPEFTYHYGFLIGISKDNDEYDKYKITFNLSAYDSWRKVAASFLKLSFTLTMAIGTYKKFKGEL